MKFWFLFELLTKTQAKFDFFDVNNFVLWAKNKLNSEAEQLFIEYNWVPNNVMAIYCTPDCTVYKI